jgi:hypothetical protein
MSPAVAGDPAGSVNTDAATVAAASNFSARLIIVHENYRSPTILSWPFCDQYGRNPAEPNW